MKDSDDCEQGEQVARIWEGVDQRDRSHCPVTAEVGRAEEEAKIDIEEVGEGESFWQGWGVAAWIVKLGEDRQGGALQQQTWQKKES